MVMDVREALSCAWEYLDLAELHPPPEPRAIRDHLQAMLQVLSARLQRRGVCETDLACLLWASAQGVLQWGESGDVWALLGNDRLAAPSQFRDLLRLAGECRGP